MFPKDVNNANEIGRRLSKGIVLPCYSNFIMLVVFMFVVALSCVLVSVSHRTRLYVL